MSTTRVRAIANGNVLTVTDAAPQAGEIAREDAERFVALGVFEWDGAPPAEKRGPGRPRKVSP